MFYYEVQYVDCDTKKAETAKGITAGNDWNNAVKQIVDFYGDYDDKSNFGLVSIDKMYLLEEILDIHDIAGLFKLLIPYENKKSSDKITDEQIDQLLDCMAKGEYDPEEFQESVKEATDKFMNDLKNGEYDEYYNFIKKGGVV